MCEFTVAFENRPAITLEPLRVELDEHEDSPRIHEIRVAVSRILGQEAQGCLSAGARKHRPSRNGQSHPVTKESVTVRQSKNGRSADRLSVGFRSLARLVSRLAASNPIETGTIARP